MLAIRMQRTGRKGHAQYRVVVQDSRFSPSSGRVVAYLGNYDPHTKQTTLDTDKVSNYLSNGARPSERVVRLLKGQGVKLPEWVSEPAAKERTIRNADKLRRNRSAEEPAAPEEPVVAEAPAANEPQETPPESAAEETPAAENETPVAETPAPEEAAAEEPAASTEEAQPAEPEADTKEK